MLKEGVSKEKNDAGSFIVKPYTKWSYSSGLVAMEEDLKIKKLNEQESGVATAEVTMSLTFTPTKVG